MKGGRGEGREGEGAENKDMNKGLVSVWRGGNKDATENGRQREGRGGGLAGEWGQVGSCEGKRAARSPR